MKYLFCLLIAVTSWEVIKAMTVNDASSALEGFGENCDSKPNKEDLINIVKNEKDVPKSTKCFRLCLMKQMNLLNDGKLDSEQLKDLIGMVWEDKEEETVEMTNICNTKVTSEDECDTAHEYAMCLLGEMQSRGWPIPELDESD